MQSPGVGMSGDCGRAGPKAFLSRAQGLPAELQLLRLLPSKHHPGTPSVPARTPSLCGMALIVCPQPLLLILVPLTQAADGG